MSLTTVLPMAGRGSRFAQAGYTTPKPFIDLAGEPMFIRVLANLPDADRVVLPMLEDHKKHFKKTALAKDPAVVAVPINAVTRGAAETVLYALKKGKVALDDEVIVANSDQLLEWMPGHFLTYVRDYAADGAIVTFRASGPKWSYALVKEDGTVSIVAEKVQISDDATCGVYYFRTAGLLKSAIEDMIDKDIRTNGEFYLAPVYNELLVAKKRVLNYPVPKMFGLGTPEDLEASVAELSLFPEL